MLSQRALRNARVFFWLTEVRITRQAGDGDSHRLGSVGNVSDEVFCLALEEVLTEADAGDELQLTLTRHCSDRVHCRRISHHSDAIDAGDGILNRHLIRAEACAAPLRIRGRRHRSVDRHITAPREEQSSTAVSIASQQPVLMRYVCECVIADTSGSPMVLVVVMVRSECRCAGPSTSLNV